MVCESVSTYVRSGVHADIYAYMCVWGRRENSYGQCNTVRGRLYLAGRKQVSIEKDTISFHNKILF